MFPSTDVINICKVAEDTFVSYYLCKKGIFKQLVLHATKMVSNSTLILNHDFSTKIKESEHRISLVKKIVPIYLELRIIGMKKMYRDQKKAYKSL